MLVKYLFHITLLLAFINICMHMVTYFILILQIIDRAATLQATGTSILPPKTKRNATLPSKITALDDFCHNASKSHNSDSHETTTDDRKYVASAKTDSESNSSDSENSENTEQKVISHVSKVMHIYK